MATARLPNIRIVSTPVSNVILLHSIGARLRSHYENLLYSPVPEGIDKVLRRLA
jgi:hypothetical protein